jgi:hypothetical protein
MSEAVIDASLLDSADLAVAEAEETRPEIGRSRKAEWNREGYAQEQIRGLVRRVFFPRPDRTVRQIVFSSVEAETDVHRICRWVGDALAVETQGRVAVAGRFQQVLHEQPMPDDVTAARERRSGSRLRPMATQARGNLWLVPADARDGELPTAASLHQYLSDLRREFDYSIVAARCAGESSEALAMAQFADGIILVLSARHTRQATARKVKAALEGSRARLAGIVLKDREFPIPDAIYRRL